MNRKQWFLCLFGVCVSVGIAVGWSIASELPLIGVFALLAGLVVLYFCRRRVTEAIEDERTENISEIAAICICILLVFLCML